MDQTKVSRGIPCFLCSLLLDLFVAYVQDGATNCWGALGARESRK